MTYAKSARQETRHTSRFGNIARDPISDNAALCLALTSSGEIYEASVGFWEHLGYTQDVPCSDGLQKLTCVLGTHDWSDLLGKAQSQGQAQFETWASRPDGTACRVQVSIDGLKGVESTEPCFFVYACDRDPLNKEHDVLLRKSLQDSLTGLFNRSYFETTATEFIAEALLNETPLAVLVLDLNDFKSINDTYGHHVGDIALKRVANSIADVLPLGETISRYGGDEFVVMLSDVASEDYITSLIQSIQSSVAQPFNVQGVTLKLSISVGFSLFPQNGHTLAQLLQWADASMYEQKRRKKYDFLNAKPKRAQKNETIKLEDVRPYYQPIVDLRTSEIVGVEALSRKVGKDGSIIYPIDFLPAAEANGTIVDFDRRMFGFVCKDMSANKKSAFSKLKVALNLSAVTLNHPDFMDELVAQVASYDLVPHHFCIELTESASLMENDPGRQSLFELHKLGFDVALDDFGTGFSSLSILKDLPISRLKIDRSFVNNIARSDRDRKIVASVLELCRSLETTSVVEGIETAEQARLVKEMGADLGQGFHYSKAIPLEHLISELN